MYPFEFIFRVFRKIIGHRKFKRNFYCGKRIFNRTRTNKYITDIINSNKPFLVARFGDAELKTLVQYHEINYGFRSDYQEKLKKVMHMNAGFFPSTKNNLNRFSEYMIESSRNVDLFGVCFNFMENFIISKYNKLCRLAY